MRGRLFWVVPEAEDPGGGRLRVVVGSRSISWCLRINRSYASSLRRLVSCSCCCRKGSLCINAVFELRVKKEVSPSLSGPFREGACGALIPDSVYAHPLI